MNVILLEKIRNLGDLGDSVTVAAGYGRNFLIPQGKAVPATKENIKHFEERRAELQAAADEKLAKAQARAEQLAGLTVTIPANAGDEGKLFGSVGTADIADAVTAQGVELEKKKFVCQKAQFVKLANSLLKCTCTQKLKLTSKLLLLAKNKLNSFKAYVRKAPSGAFSFSS